MNKRKWLTLAGFMLLCLAVGGLGGWITAPSVIAWYPTLSKPEWNPPSWVFGPVWTTLYVMMAVAAWLVWLKPETTRTALILFFIQLALNSLWSFLFFGAQSPGLALIDILALWLALALTIHAFFEHSRTASLLLLPYLAWVSFAAFLNFSIWQLN